MPLLDSSAGCRLHLAPRVAFVHYYFVNHSAVNPSRPSADSVRPSSHFLPNMISPSSDLSASASTSTPGPHADPGTDITRTDSPTNTENLHSLTPVTLPATFFHCASHTDEPNAADTELVTAFDEYTHGLMSVPMTWQPATASHTDADPRPGHPTDLGPGTYISCEFGPRSLRDSQRSKATFAPDASVVRASPSRWWFRAARRDRARSGGGKAPVEHALCEWRRYREQDRIDFKSVMMSATEDAERSARTIGQTEESDFAES